jgi:hypothetical protein
MGLGVSLRPAFSCLKKQTGREKEIKYSEEGKGGLHLTLRRGLSKKTGLQMLFFL